MNIAIIGYGEQGRSAFDYWYNKDNIVVVCDQNTDLELPPGAVDKLGIGYLENLHEFDLIVRSPAVHPQSIAEANPEHPEIFAKVTTNTNEFFKVCKAPIIGVTGTKGKGTTSTLIAKILETKGKKVHLGGNIGTPPLDLLKNNISPEDYVVLELANFQLIDLKQSPHIAVCLMIVEEHLDWHKDMYEYVRAKEQLFAHQSPQDVAVFNAKNVYASEIATKSRAHYKIPFDAPGIDEPLEYTDGAHVDGHHIKMGAKTVCSVSDVALKGRHNLQNVCAAIAATWDIIGHDTSVIKKVVRKFTGLPHRLETIAEHNKITYVDDSFGTNPSTAMVAVQAFEQPKVLILGGSEKNTPFGDLARTITQANIRHIVAIGEMGPKIIEVIQSQPGGNNISYDIIGMDRTMEDIVLKATEKAQAGDIVLLSPACASFDMFKNYKDRGEQFKRAVLALN